MIFYFHRMKLEKLSNCPHKAWFFLPSFPLESVLSVVSCVARSCPLTQCSPGLLFTVMEKEGYLLH